MDKQWAANMEMMAAMMGMFNAVNQQQMEPAPKVSGSYGYSSNNSDSSVPPPPPPPESNEIDPPMPPQYSYPRFLEPQIQQRSG